MNPENDIPQDILDELAALGKYNRVYIYSYFWEISEEHQRRHQALTQESEIEYAEGEEWQNEKYYQLCNDAQKSGYIAIVFAAM